MQILKRSNHRLLIIALLGIMPFVLAACNKQETAVTETSNSSEIYTADEINDIIRQLQPIKPDNLGTVTLNDYKDIDKSLLEEIPISEEQVIAYIESELLPKIAVPSDSSIKTGDCVILDYIETGCARYTDVSVIAGANSLPEKLDESLIGHKPNDHYEIDIEYPQDYPVDFRAGQNIHYIIDIKSVALLPELNDETANTIDDTCGNLQELTTKVRVQLEESTANTCKLAMYNNILYASMEKAEIIPSEEAIQWKTDMIIKDSFDTEGDYSAGKYCESSDLSYTAFRESLRENALDQLNQELFAEKVFEEEKLTVTEKDRREFATLLGIDEKNVDDTDQHLFCIVKYLINP